MATVAIAGCAHIHTPGFVKKLKERPGLRVKAVWDWTPERASNCATEFGARVAAAPGELWTDAEVAAVIVCSETNRHEELVLAGAAAGKHLFLDAIGGQTQAPLVSAAEAAYRSTVMEALYADANRHRWVRLPAPRSSRRTG